MPRETPQTRADAGSAAEGTPLTRALGRHKLDTLTDVRDEMARVYRAVCGGRLEIKAGQGMVYMLGQIGKATEGADLEIRIAELEERMKGQP